MLHRKLFRMTAAPSVTMVVPGTTTRMVVA